MEVALEPASCGAVSGDRSPLEWSAHPSTLPLPLPLRACPTLTSIFTAQPLIGSGRCAGVSSRSVIRRGLPAICHPRRRGGCDDRARPGRAS